MTLKFDLSEDYPHLSRYKDTIFLAHLQAIKGLYIDINPANVDKIIPFVGTISPLQPPAALGRAAWQHYE